jgi:DNA mismatch repair protein MutS
MVEMNETALILNNISDRSFLLDEIGRGTSTLWRNLYCLGIAEFLHEHPSSLKHYLQRITMSEMSESLPRIQNYNVAVKELKDTVLC